MSDNFQQVIQLAFQTLGAEDAQKVADVLQNVGGAGEAANTKIRPLIDEFERLAEQSKLVGDALDLSAKVDANQAALSRAKQSLADLNAEFSKTDKSSADVNVAFAQAQKQVTQLANEQLKLQRASETSGTQLKAAGVDATQLGTAHTQLKAKTAEAAQQLVAASTAARNTGEAFHESGEKAKEAGTLFGFAKEHLKEIISIAAAVEIALKGIEFGKESLAGATALEAQLSRVKAAASDAQGQFAELDDEVEKAAQAANTTSQNAATGLTALVNSGKSANDAIAALVPTLQLAKIANIDVGQAADLVAKNLDAFNLPATQATKVVDLLTAASHGSATALATISSAAAELAPDARTLGLDFDRTVGILGLLADKGFNAGNSVRALRTIFQDLQNPTSTLRADLLALGDGTGDFNNAVTYLTAGTPRANQALQTLSGGARSVIELLGQAGPAAVAKFTAELEKQNGLAARLSKVLDDNLKGAETRFGNSIEALGTKLAKPLLEPFKNELNKLAEDLNRFAESPDFKDIEKEIGEMATNAASAIDTFLRGIDWKSFLNDAKSSLAGVVDDLKAVADSASAIASAVNKTADVIGVAYHGLGTAVDGVVAGAAKGVDAVVTLQEKTAALVEGTDQAAKHYEGLHAALQSVGDEGATQAAAHIEKLGGDLADLAGSAEKAAESTRSHGDAAAEAAPKLEGHGDAAHKSSTAVNDLKIALLPISPIVELAAEAFDNLTAAEKAEAIAIRQSAVGAKLSKEAVENLATAFSKIGGSQAALKSAADDAKKYFETIDKYSANTAAGLADRQRAFLFYAKAALDAAAQLDEGTRNSLKYELESKAAILGVTQALKDLEDQSSRSASALTSDAARSAAALSDTSAAASQAADSTQAIGDAAASAGDGLEAFKARGTGLLQALDDAIATTRSGFLAISEDAAKAFDASFKGFFDLGFSSTGTGADRVMDALTKAIAKTNEEVAKSRRDLSQMIAEFKDVGNAGGAAFTGLGGYINGDIASMESFIEQIDSGTFKLGVLGQQDLAPLRAALEDAINREKELQAQADAARKKFEDLALATEDALDQAEGNKKGLEDRRHKQILQDLYDAAKEAGKLNSTEYNKAVAREKELHDKKLKDIAEEQDAIAHPNKGLNGKASTEGAGGGAAYFGSGGSHRLEVTFNGKRLGNLDHFELQDLAKQIAPHIAKEIAGARRNSGGYPG